VVLKLLDGRTGQRYVWIQAAAFEFASCGICTACGAYLFAFDWRRLRDAAARLITRVDRTNLGSGDDDPERKAA